MWDLSFWTTWFDEMARHRYNVLSLWSPHPFTSMLKMADYPDAAIQGVEGYDVDGKTAAVNAMTIDDKIAFWRKVMRYGRGMMDYASAHPERNLVFIHRQHQGNVQDMLEAFAPLGKLPNVRLDLSFKYSQAHAHAAVKPEYWDREKMAEGLDRHGLKSWLTVRNDDFYFLHWADPQFVRDYVRNFPEVGKHVDAFYIGADGWVFTREFTSKDPYYQSRNALSIQKTWYMQKLWGRIS